MVFTTLCFVQLGNALSVRSVYHSMFSSKIFANHNMWGAIVLTIILQLFIVYLPFLQPVFSTVALTWNMMAMILISTLVCILCMELFKYINKRKYLKNPN
jgi:Ca2+-transporting ATPase